MTSASRRYRVVQWATGNIGTKSLREVIRHPAMDLVGLWVHSSEKAGRDAGELCGEERTGVLATNTIDEILAVQADCVLYMPQACDFDEVCRLLESGANVVTTRGEFHRPASLHAEVRERVEAACARGGTSIHSTGSSPGFISEAVPIVLASIQRRLDGITIDEFADMSKRNSPQMIFELMGFGGDPSGSDERRATHLAHAFGPSLEVTAEALGLPLDAVEATSEVATARNDVEIAAGTIPRGTVGAQRHVVAGMRRGRPLLTFRANWYCTTDVDADWDLGETGWRVTVEGDAPLKAEMRFGIPLERMAATSPGYTANRAVNAVPVVCEAAPGIRTSVELPQVIADLSTSR